jgi:hypothetical protein
LPPSNVKRGAPLDGHLVQACAERAPAAGAAGGLARRFLPPAQQSCVLAMEALFASLRAVPLGVSEPAVGLAKLAWWESELRDAATRSSQHPVVEALRRTGALGRLQPERFEPYLSAIAGRLDAAPFGAVCELRQWLRETRGAEALMLLARGPDDGPQGATAQLGTAAGLLELLEGWMPGAERPAWVPLDLVARAGTEDAKEDRGRAAMVAGLAKEELLALEDVAVPETIAAGDAPAATFLAARHAVVRRRLHRLGRRPSAAPGGGAAGLGDVFAAWSAARRHRSRAETLE